MNALNLMFLNELKEHAEREQFRLKTKQLRDESNPFEIPNPNFIKTFRLSKEAAFDLIEQLQAFIQPERSTGIPPHLQVLLCLNFFAAGSYQNCAGYDWKIMVSQPTASRIIRKIVNIFTNNLLAEYVSFPNNNIKINRTKASFQEKLHFPNVIGAVECTHIGIVAPNQNENGVAYLNRKGFYSLNVQMVCNADLLITAVNARYPGSTHDSAIWETSTINRFLQNRFERGIRNEWILGDSGYPLRPWIMTPIPDALPDTPEGIYTQRHCSARNCVERCFGLLKARFRCLLKHRILHYDPTTAAKIVYSCVVLHNICINRNIVMEDDLQENEQDGQDNVLPVQALGQDNFLEQGRFVRNGIIRMLQ